MEMWEFVKAFGGLKPPLKPRKGFFGGKREFISSFVHSLYKTLFHLRTNVCICSAI